jgi:hypothetical protein
MTPAQCAPRGRCLAFRGPSLAKLAVMPVSLIADFEAGVSTARATDINAMKWAPRSRNSCVDYGLA